MGLRLRRSQAGRLRPSALNSDQNDNEGSCPQIDDVNRKKICGFLMYGSDDPIAEDCHDLDPYFENLERACKTYSGLYYTRLGGIEKFSELFLRVARYFSNSEQSIDDNIRTFSEKLQSEGAIVSTVFTPDEALMIVLHHIGLWLLMEESFRVENFSNRWMDAYCIRNNCTQETKNKIHSGDISLRVLLSGSGLFLSPIVQGTALAAPLIHTGAISQAELNAYSLCSGRIEIQWSNELPDHLDLRHDPDGTRLLVFRLPCILKFQSTCGPRLVVTRKHTSIFQTTN